MNKKYVDKITMLASSIDVMEPTAYVIMVSNGVNFQGGAGGIDNLSQVDKVDLVSYLIRQLGLTLDDVAEKDQLTDEVHLMNSIISKEQRTDKTKMSFRVPNHQPMAPNLLKKMMEK